MNVATVRPRRTPGVRVDEATGEVLLRDPAGVPVRLNETALALWELCDGDTAIEEMVDAVDALFAVDRATAEQDVLRTVGELAEAGLVSWSHGNEASQR